ncbi:MAG: polysaccharide deacetylase family protein [Flavobacteriaceae bacterium]|jgi:peptidoglycan/xylan/chitin deacetylase (PgdA/CDA1 family)|nr:polysaccharide deacetylase family protein [Flavobacteriaceae bacterium]
MVKLKLINCLGVLYFLVVGVAFANCGIHWSWFILGVFVWIGLLAWGSFDIRQNIFVQAISSSKNETNKRIAITFDDGPTLFTPHVLALLKSYQAKATFFCIGKQVEQFPHLLQQIHSEGHCIGNHTYTHTHKMGFLSATEVLEEIQLADSAIQKVIGKQPLYFRPPFGVTNPNISKALKQTHYKVIGWNIRSLDTVIAEEERIFERIKKKIKPGAIILLHDTTDKTVAVLALLLDYLKQQGYEMVSINELLNSSSYEKDA